MIAKEIIGNGQAILGIEFGSTRIKSVLIGPDHTILASGSLEWESELLDGVWTYYCGGFAGQLCRSEASG